MSVHPADRTPTPTITQLPSTTRQGAPTQEGAERLEEFAVSHLDSRRVQEIKDDFLSTGAPTPAPAALSTELLLSWERSRAAIGEPSNIRDVPHVAEESLDAHVLDMFQAPLSRLSDELDGTGLGLLLADTRGRILQRWSQERSAVAHLDRLGTVRGAVLAEDVVGTNGVGTVAATGKSVQISGAEHFAEIYSDAVCTGSPVRHPGTGKLIAVITVSGSVGGRSELLRPLVRSVAAQLEQQVLDAEQPAARAMLAAFVHAARTQPGPVVAFGPQGLVMQSQRAGRLTAADLNLLQQLSAQSPRTGRFVAELSTGTAELQVTALEEGAGTVIAFGQERRSTTLGLGPARPQLIGRAPEWLAVAHLVGRHRESRRPVVVAGEPGVGKTSLALGLPYRPGAGAAAGIVADAAERHVLGSRKWLNKIADRLTANAPVVVRGVETLEENALRALGSLVENAPAHGPVILTVSAGSRDEAEGLTAPLGFPVVWVPPLRERASDIPALWHAFAEQLAPGAGLEARPDTLEILRSYAWPRNLKELRGIPEELALAGKRGAVTPLDLPSRMQGTRVLSMIERVELEAIRRALHEADGNRSKAAEILGLSRATVYRKMKAYRLTA